LQRQVQVLNAELVDTKTMAASQSQDIETLQMELENLSVAQEKEAQRAVDDENLTVIRGELQRQAEYLQTVETENIKLRSELTVLRRKQANAEILKEQIHELERKARGADEAREEAVRLKAKLEASRKEVEDWYVQRGLRCSGTLISVCRASRKSTPASTSKTLTELRLNLARLAEERDSAVALVQLHEKDLTDSQSRLAEEQILKEKFKAELELLKTKAERQVRRTQLTEREVSYLKAMLVSARLIIHEIKLNQTPGKL
jgi:mitotic spindle assembly checkpoint protein MAD1